ncbi:MAG: hypothetical protein ACOC41_09240 [Chitinivibrionales bacterium]
MNIGCVVYTKDPQTGNLTADWHYAPENNPVTGTGKAQGMPGEQYAGEYVITYYNAVGIEAGTFTLHIEEKQAGFSLIWYQDGKKKYTGCGMMHENVLIAGWKRFG